MQPGSWSVPGTTGSQRPPQPEPPATTSPTAGTPAGPVLVAERPATDHDPAKRAMRERIRAERRARPAAERAAAAQALADVLLELPELARSGCVAGYASTPAEPGTEPLLGALRRFGVRVLLPVPLDDGSLDWAVDDGRLGPGRGPGGPVPGGPRLGRDSVRQAGVMIVPALAVDTLGNRLGQGAGFYDRTLRLLDPAVPVLALVHDGEVMDAAVEPVPAAAHDQPVDAVVTPHRCLRLPRRRR